MQDVLNNIINKQDDSSMKEFPPPSFISKFKINSRINIIPFLHIVSKHESSRQEISFVWHTRQSSKLTTTVTGLPLINSLIDAHSLANIRSSKTEMMSRRLIRCDSIWGGN